MAPFLKLLELAFRVVDWVLAHSNYAKSPELVLSTPLTEADKPMPDKEPDITIVPEKAPPIDLPVINLDGTDELYADWDNPSHAYHNVRALCDLGGLSYAKTILVDGRYVSQKDILVGCVANESNFLTNPKPNQNKDEHGKVWSTDWGIVQINDHYHIGPGKDFPSVDYVLTHPQICVQWMVNYYKKYGDLSPWVSYTSGAYKHYLPR